MTAEPLSRESVFAELNPLFQSVFDDDRIRVFETMSSKDVKGWDSLNHINLIVAIEKRFHVKFRTSEVVRLQNVGQLVDLVLAKFPK